MAVTVYFISTVYNTLGTSFLVLSEIVPAHHKENIPGYYKLLVQTIHIGYTDGHIWSILLQERTDK